MEVSGFKGMKFTVNGSSYTILLFTYHPILQLKATMAQSGLFLPRLLQRCGGIVVSHVWRFVLLFSFFHVLLG